MEADEAMLQLIMTRAREQGSAIDINYQGRPRTLKWWLIAKFLQGAFRIGLSSSDLTMSLAHSEGSTALHYASRQVRRPSSSPCFAMTSHSAHRARSNS